MSGVLDSKAVYAEKHIGKMSEQEWNKRMEYGILKQSAVTVYECDCCLKKAGEALVSL